MIFILHIPALPEGSLIKPQHIPAVALEKEDSNSTVHLVLNTKSVDEARLFAQFFAHRNRIDIHDIDLRKAESNMNSLGVTLTPLHDSFTVFEGPDGQKIKVPVFYWSKKAFNSERVLL